MATEQQNHLKQVAEQSNTLVSEINSLEGQAKSKREMLMKLQGIAEYLDGLGVKLPTEEEGAEGGEATEVVTPDVETPATE
tara:strand:- start:9471 stop:9713 length:243 start_codon:yes stop_codon:yes gene_type:complete